MATIEDLDDDSLRAVLVRVPLDDFVRNIKPVSRRFRQGNELAFKDKIEREPIEFVVWGQCRHNYALDTGLDWPHPPQVFFAKVRATLAKLGDLPNSSLMPYVSKVILGDAYCETLSELRSLLQAILDMIPPGAEIQLEPYKPGHYNDLISGDTHSARLRLRGPLRQVAFSAADLLRTTRSLAICGGSLGEEEMMLSRGDARDFAQLLGFTEQLTSLRLPAGFFPWAARRPRVLLNLEKLRIDAYHSTGEGSCLAQLAFVFNFCPNLVELRYDCESCRWPSSRSTCRDQPTLADIIPLPKLAKLRSLSLRLGRAFFEKEDADEPHMLPAVEFLHWSILTYSPQDFRSLLQEIPNLKVLELDASARLMAEIGPIHCTTYYEVIRDLLLTGRYLKQLTTIRVNAAEYEADCYTEIRHLTEMAVATPLRRLEVLDLTGAVVLASAAAPKRKRRQDDPSSSLDLARCIRQASNVVDFRLCVDWRKDGYARLGDVFEAMQYGSVLQLSLLADWMKIDRAAVARVLPPGYQIHEWNVKAGGNSNKFASCLIRGSKNLAELPGGQFWIRLIQFIPED